MVSHCHLMGSIAQQNALDFSKNYFMNILKPINTKRSTIESENHASSQLKSLWTSLFVWDHSRSVDYWWRHAKELIIRLHAIETKEEKKDDFEENKWTRQMNSFVRRCHCILKKGERVNQNEFVIPRIEDNNVLWQTLFIQSWSSRDFSWETMQPKTFQRKKMLIIYFCNDSNITLLCFS